MCQVSLCGRQSSPTRHVARDSSVLSNYKKYVHLQEGLRGMSTLTADLTDNA